MAQPMPTDNPFLQFPFGPIQMECDAPDLVIEGTMPPELNGTLYRNGPNQHYRPRGDYHLFAGDGMVHGFHIKNGRVRYNNRWVRTAKWLAEDKEGRAVINPMNPFDCDPEYLNFFLSDKEGLANTSVVWHGGRLLALEEGHHPYEIDPHTLASVGTYNYEGDLSSAMTAHPKIDPRTGELLFFGYMATGIFSADVMLYTSNAEGKITHRLLFQTPYCAMVHDFVFTENYIIVPIFPMIGSIERAMSGAQPFAWEPEKGASVAVIPRGSTDPKDVRWIPMDICFAFHFMNAFEKDGVLTVDCSQFDHPPLFPSASGERMGPSKPYLTRWQIDLNDANARVQFKRLGDYESEFPQCDSRHAGFPYRHGWHTSPDGTVKSTVPDGEFFHNAIAHVDHETGKVERYSFGNAVTSEGIFVPKNANAAEGEGYVLCVVTSCDTQLSALYVLDALRVTDGPIAIARLSHRVPSGFHGFWRQNG